MNQLTMGLLVAVGLFCFFLYNENQTLTQNNIKLEESCSRRTTTCYGSNERTV